MATFTKNGLTFVTTGSGGANVTGPQGINFYIEDATDPASIETAFSRAASSPNTTPAGAKLLQNLTNYNAMASSASSAINAESNAAAAASQPAATTNTNPSDDTSRAAPVKKEDPVTPAEEKAIKSTDKKTDTNTPVVTTGAGAGRGNYTGYNAADEVKNKAALAVGNNKAKKEFKELPNPLDELQSYTYGLTLFALTKDDYNKLVDTTTAFTPSKALISSAGRYQDVRDSNFKEDFYFDSFKVSTVIGMNATNRSSNAITMDFTIIEPYGMTLLDRIMSVSMTELAAKNYLDIPYLLRLEFFGTDDQGNVKKLTEHTKNFPIKLISFKIKASVKGAEYAVQAVPFNHGANLESIQALKTRIEVTADTVQKFFDSTEEAPKMTDEYASDSTRNATAYAYQSGQAGAGGGRGTARHPRIIGDTPPEESVKAASKPTSFTAAYNAWNISSTKNGDAKVADQIRFVIDKDIANSKIADPKSTTVKRSGESDAKTEAKSQDGKSATTLDTSKVVHSFEAGSTVNDIINAIIPNSEFFLNQVKDPSKNAKSTSQDGAASDSTVQDSAQTLKMWKIIPSIKLADFDTERNVWGKIITFYVKKYDAYQQRDARLPKSPPPGALKRYDYFYTGKNSSVINFDIDFNALYFTASQIDRSNTESTAGAQARPESGDNDGSTSVGGKPGIGSGERKVNTGSQMQTGVAGANNRSETQNAQSALQSVYTSAAGDMINLKLQIIGDPHFIKQDDLFIVPDMTSVAGDGDSAFVSPKVQSLNMDAGEIYCYVTFKTPVDFSDTTGMYDLSNTNKFHTSEFSGYYKILTVDSEFRQGKFTQTLTMIRYPMQDSPNVSASQKTTPLDNKRTETPAKTKVETPPVPAPKKTEDAPAVSKPAPPKEAEATKDEKLADVAKTGETKTLEEAKPVTGEAVVAPETGNNKTAKLQQDVTNTQQQIQDLQSQNNAIQSKVADLQSQSNSLTAQFNTLEDQAGDKPTADQAAQLQQLRTQINNTNSQKQALYQDAIANNKAAMNLADSVNKSIVASGLPVNGIALSETAYPQKYVSGGTFPNTTIN